MRRKDCDITEERAMATEGRLCPRSAPAIIVAAGLLFAAPTSAEHVRLWPTAVVVADTIRVADLCDLQGFDPADAHSLADAVVAEAPPPGGSRLIQLDLVRTALRQHGVNIANITLGGAATCEVSRPAEIKPPATEQSSDASRGRPRATAEGSDDSARAHETLRDAALDHFREELARYGGRPDIVFERASDQLLELSAPKFTFRIRRRPGPLLGLVQIEADLFTEGRLARTVPLVVQVSLIRNEVVARRPINQGATIARDDVKLVATAVTRLDRIGISDPARVIGQRARRFIATGEAIDPELLEAVPLVTRGQLVTLASVEGGIRVVTAAKALRDGLLGEVIPVRATDNRRVELEAVVVGPGTVQVGGRPRARLALRKGGAP